MAPAAVPGFNLLRHDTSSLLQCAASHHRLPSQGPGNTDLPHRFGQRASVMRGRAPLDHRFMPKTTFRGYLIALPCAARYSRFLISPFARATAPATSAAKLEHIGSLCGGTEPASKAS